MIPRLLLLLGLLLLPLAAAARDGGACGDLGPVPDAVQVAWVSPLTKTVGAGSWLDVVRVADLRSYLSGKGVTPLRLLQALGVVNGKGRGRAAKKSYKVTIFDVRSTWLCRPLRSGAADKVVSGVAICAPRQQEGTRRSFTGCGYTRDTVTGGRGLDTFKVRWRDASSGGFCVLPLERFAKGA